MAERGDNNFMRYVYRGEEDEVIPPDATHIFVTAKIIPERAFNEHANIVEVICHKDVEKIEKHAFLWCPRLRRVIMPGVKIVEEGAFQLCKALVHVECGQLEIIKHGAFIGCKHLRSINLPSARIVEGMAFLHCEALMEAKFGIKLERIEESAFLKCTSLEWITIPLKDGFINHDDTFQGCEKLKYVDLIEGEFLLETVAALHLGEWKNDANEEIDSINHILPTVAAGNGYLDVGEKAPAIRTWIRSVLRQLVRYKEEHRRLLDEDVAPILKRFVPQDIVMNNVIPFLNLPPQAFE